MVENVMGIFSCKIILKFIISDLSYEKWKKDYTQEGMYGHNTTALI